MSQTSFAKNKLKVMLLEGVHQNAVANFEQDGYSNIDYLSTSLPEDELCERVKDVHFIGLRSRTQLNSKVLQAAEKLCAVGCFCIGTNQVDLECAESLGVPVFNAPFSNTRSVAELVIAEIIMLSRGIPAKNAGAHRGQWYKSANNSHEVRGKRLGIIGYGHIGTQLSIMAENLGMHVSFYDVESKLALGNAHPVNSLNELLAESDFVSLHVPQTPETKNMIGARELKLMPKGSYLINASRGTVVDIPALAEAIKSEHLFGAAVDVFPTEPKSNKESFESELRGLDNVILTPHVGGSTLEAQANIGAEVSAKLIKYSNNGSTMSATNFPEVALPEHTGKRRLLHIHRNVPGVLTAINEIFSQTEVNIAAQFLQTSNQIGYVVLDVEANNADLALEKMKGIDGTIRSRILY